MRRWILALAVALGVAVVPSGRAAACDCALLDLAQAVADADVAVVGTLVGQSEPAIDPVAAPGTEQRWTWRLERSRDPIPGAEVTLLAPMNDGANCGVSFGLQERWLVLAHDDGGVLRTNSCLPNRLLTEADPEVEAIVATFQPVEEGGQDTGLTIPTPVLGLAAVVAVIGVVSLWAFRRERAS